MRDNTFTPGPWRVEQGTTLVWGACNPDDKTTYGMGYPISECLITPISRGWAKGPNYDEGEANAHLIAAAPDMYDALWAAVELSDRTLPRYGRTPECQRVYDQCVAALNLADGGK